MLTDEQILALKARCEKHQDILMRDRKGVCLHVFGVKLDWVDPQVTDAPAEAVALLSDLRIVPLREANRTDFVTLKPWDGRAAPSESDNLSLLQDAARSGLDVNFMTGDVRLPPGTVSVPRSAQ